MDNMLKDDVSYRVFAEVFRLFIFKIQEYEILKRDTKIHSFLRQYGPESKENKETMLYKRVDEVVGRLLVYVHGYQVEELRQECIDLMIFLVDKCIEDYDRQTDNEPDF